MRLTIFVVVALFAVSAITLLILRVSRSGSLPGITVSGADVGGLSGQELRVRLRALEAELGHEQITIESSSSASRLDTTGAGMGYEIDAIETANAVLERGRQGNPFRALMDHLIASFGTITLAPTDDLGDTAFATWQKVNADVIATEPFVGDIEFSGTRVEPVYPRPGEVLVEDELRSKALSAAVSPGEDLIRVSTDAAEPPTNARDVDAVVEAASGVVAAPISLTRPNGSLTIAPRELTRLIAVRLVDEGEATLELVVRPRVLNKTVGERAAGLETEPVDARFELSGSGVGIIPSIEGFGFDAKRAAGQILGVATKPGRTAQLKGDVVPAGFTTKDAKALNINEQVSSFTTEHDCCEPRVTNIHVIADIVDGVVVGPGESFSLNDFVGPRTESNGFVGAPAIRDGEFVEEIGGGISQFATTFFNAIYFGGYDLLEYQAHSYYISRYPAGREATISTPAPDLAFLNDSDAGIYIDTAYTDTSITVSFYGSTGGEVTSVSGEPYNYKQPGRECRANESLGKGEEVVVDSGHTGFDIEVTRVFADGSTEGFFTRYESSPVIVERKRC